MSFLSMSIVCFENPVLRTESQKETINTFVSPLFNGLWPLNKATRFTGGRLLSKTVSSGCPGYFAYLAITFSLT